MSVKLSKRNLLLGLYIAGAALLAVTGVLWWDHRNTSPERVFWGTVRQGMMTSGVTVETKQSGTGSSLHQTVQYSMGGQAAVHTLTNLVQGGTTIIDEAVATPAADYTRYTSIKTDQKTASGKTMDFSKVLGIWAKSGGDSGQQLPQAILGTNLPLGGVVIPLAQLQPAQRDKLYSQIQKDGLYDISFKDVTASHKDGRLVYTYKVSIQPEKYATMMKQFGKSTGLHMLDALNPEQYAGQPAFTVVLTIDARAHQLVSAASEDGNIKQTYTAYDMPAIITVPTHAISSTEMQKRLQELQQ